MPRWGRDILIAALALAAGYAMFAPTAPAPKPSKQYALASFGNDEPIVAAPDAAASTAIASSAPAPDKDSTKENIAKVLTAAAIAAILVTQSRNAYYATGRPCACPDDLNRGGRRCGGNSAYSRPGGASPYCSPSDVPIAAIEKYRQRISAR
jgi:hypothetical protein